MKACTTCGIVNNEIQFIPKTNTCRICYTGKRRTYYAIQKKKRKCIENKLSLVSNIKKDIIQFLRGNNNRIRSHKKNFKLHEKLEKAIEYFCKKELVSTNKKLNKVSMKELFSHFLHFYDLGFDCISKNIFSRKIRNIFKYSHIIKPSNGMTIVYGLIIKLI